MSISFNEFLKKAQGPKKDVQVVSSRPLGVDGKMISQEQIIKQKQSEAESAKQYAEKQSSPIGFAKNIISSLAETSGITPTARRIGAASAPYVLPQEELPDVVEELAGGVKTEKRRMGDIGNFLENIGASKNVAEGVDIAADLPLISVGLSKAISNAITKQGIKTTPQLTKFLSKPLSEFLPKAVTKIAQTDVSTPIKNISKDVIDIGSGFTDKIGNIAQKTKTTLFGKGKQINNIDDVIKQADESLKNISKPSEIRAMTETVTAQPSLPQRWAGVTNDIKNRIAGKQEKLMEYFDVAHARNDFDTLPTPLEYGAKNVDSAVTKMEEVLNDTGSRIGRFRKKIGTYEAQIDKIAKVENSFLNELQKLNLEIRRGVIRQKPGTVTRVNSESEIKILNDLYDDLLTVKENPSLEKLIDIRNRFDSKINFEKSTREASSVLDGLSRSVRKQIADVSAEIVGKSEAGNLERYSDFMDGYNMLKSYTDRRAGAEFLLKQVLSERGRAPREVMQIIKEFTGIDLMDDAVMSSLATDLIGNSRQKGLFRQEITKAGLDAAAILKGDTKGAIDLMTNVLKKFVIDEEKQFLKAAK